MTVNDKIIYLTFIEIEKLLDKSKIEYQSLDNRIEFYANNDEQVIIDLINFESLGFIKTKILPFAIVALFGIAFFAVSARIWLPGDMMSPAPIN